MNIKNKSRKFLALALILTFILPVFNFGVINAAAATDALTVNYPAGCTFEEAYGGNPTDVRALTIKGEGELTFDDCRFITEFLTVLSINFTEAKFLDNKVPDEAFRDFHTLVSVALPPSVAEIGKNAFYNCFTLKNIGFTGNLKVINDSAFYNCNQLETIALPAAMTKIGENAFTNCGSLMTVLALKSDGSGYHTAANAFSNIYTKCVLITPFNSTGYGGDAFSKLAKTEWKFYTLPQDAGVAAGFDYAISVDVTGADGAKAKYQWYRDGYEIYGADGDTLVFKNITPEYAGRYSVAITINGARVFIGCFIEVGGTAKGATTISSKNTAPEHLPEPVKTKYDYMKCADSNDKIIGEFEIDLKTAGTKEFYGANKIDTLTYTAYTKKIKELYDKDNSGNFMFHFSTSGSGGGVKVPYSIIHTNSLKDIDLTKDNQLRMTIEKTGDFQYRVYFAATDENGKVLYDFKDANHLPGVYMYLPFDNNNNSEYMIRIDEAINELRSLAAYPVPFAKENNFMKFKIQNNLLYSRQSPAPADFTDIKNHWGANHIIHSAKNLIVNGYPDGSYKPEGVLTRAEFTATLTRVLYHTLVWDQSRIKDYGDVKASDWFSEAVKIANIVGLTGFLTEPKFRPSQQILREEMAYMIEKALLYAGIETSKFSSPAAGYSDLSDIDTRFRGSVTICTNSKLLQGSDGKFMPKKTLTRAEAATVLTRLMDLLAGSV